MIDSPQPINHPDPDNPEPIFPGMPHDIHRALSMVLRYAGSAKAAGDLLADYEMKIK